MITIPTLTAPGQIVQHLVPPAVYLDHWAFNEMARNEELAARFTEGMEQRGGTLAFSWGNVAEFGKVLDEEQARHAERFIINNAQFPRVFCIEIDPFRVIKREERGDRSPESDDLLLSSLAGLKADPPHVITANGLLTVVRGRLDQRHERLASIFLERYEALSAAYADDQDFRRLVKQMPRSAATRSVLRQILAAFLVDKAWKAHDHDVMDFYHAVVPSVYCQCVLLDRDWADHVGRAQRTLRDTGADRPMATVMAKRAGVEQLLAWLEGN